jgi:hypothetical protein
MNGTKKAGEVFPRHHRRLKIAAAIAAAAKERESGGRRTREPGVKINICARSGCRAIMPAVMTAAMM